MTNRKIKIWMLLGSLSFVLLMSGCSGLGSSDAGAKEQTQQSGQAEQAGKTAQTGQTAANSKDQELTRQIPNSIAFWNTQQGLLVTSSNGQGIVWKTTDGGQQWTKVYASQEALSNVVLTGANGAKVLVGDWKSPSAQLVTADGGQSWTEGTYQKPSFASQACAMGRYGEDLYVNHSAPTSQKIWVLCDGQVAAGQMTKEIVASTDGGKTWSKQTEVGLGSNNSGLALNGYPEGIDFLSNGYGWLWEVRGYAYSTQDGGQHWTSMSNLTSPEAKEAHSMSLIDAEHGYALLWDNEQYRLMYTTNGGQSWQEVISWANQNG